MIDRGLDRGLEVAGLGVGRGTAVAGAAWRLPGQLLAHGGVRRDPDVGQLGPLPLGEARTLATPDGGRLFTTAHGHGPPFLFAHGFAATSRVWTKQFRVLPPAGIRAVAFDQRGHGQSTSPVLAPPAGPSIDQLADDIRLVVEDLDLRDALAVGHALGGMALVAFAARYPEVAAARLRGLVLVSTGARMEAARIPLLARLTVPFAAGFVRSGAWARSDWSRAAARLLFGGDPSPSQVELVRVLLASADEETVLEDVRALTSLDVRAQLRRVDLPTLVVNGTSDLLVTPGDARRLARGIPGARLELVPGAGHMVMLEQAERLGALLCGFARAHGIAVGLAA